MKELIQDHPTVIVTGGSRGIGQAIALRLAADGYQIILTYVSRPGQAEETVAAIEAANGRAKALQLNVGDTGAIAEFFTEFVKDRVNLFALINNAGITRDGLLLRMKDEAFTEVLDVNLVGAFACSREAAKIMTKKRQGRIVNISSVVGQMGNAGQANYSAAKAGLIGLTKSCAKELAARNITVNCIAPGFIATEMTGALDEEIRERYEAAIPLRRLGTVEDVASAASFLISPGASYITGQVIAVNGGLYC